MKGKSLSLAKAIFLILGFTLSINTAAFLGIKAYFYLTKREPPLEQGICAIVQTGPQKEALRSDYLAELMGLSCNQTIPVKQFELKKAKKDLLASPVIKEAEIKLLSEGVLYVDYTVRQPCLLLSDFENVALDNKGIPFPIRPFFSPKKLPEVYLGMSFVTLQWNEPIKDEKLKAGLAIYQLIYERAFEESFQLRRIDVSKMQENSYGRREIVVILEEEFAISLTHKTIHFILPIYLRLSIKQFAQELANYFSLRQALIEKEKLNVKHQTFVDEVIKLNPKVVDLRISQLAFIDTPKE